MSSIVMSKTRKFVKDGLFQAELNAFLKKSLSENGFAGVEIRYHLNRTEIIIRATRTRDVLGEKGRRIRELTSLLQKRFDRDSLELLAERVESRGLCATVQAESLCFKLMQGLPVRRAAYGVVKHIMESGARGCEITVSGKLRAQRAKRMIFKDGIMIATGEPKNDFIDSATHPVSMKQGVLGVTVHIMHPYDPTGRLGPSKPLPDYVCVFDPVDLE